MYRQCRKSKPAVLLRLLLLCSTVSASMFVSTSTTTTTMNPISQHCRRHINNHGYAPSWRHLLLTRQFAVKVIVRIVGKKSSGEKWIDQGCQMYETRLRPNNVDVVTEWYKTNDALVRSVQNDISKSTTGTTAPIILLDLSLGKETTSEGFSNMFYDWAELGGSRLVFVIGGADGLPEELVAGSSSSLLAGREAVFYCCLSKLTFTHQFARLVLLEQIYRASEIRKGSSYHK
ncbi:hypothetical protein ACA910_000912 [Epithemia clementina (nom. ined.)]